MIQDTIREIKKVNEMMNYDRHNDFVQKQNKDRRDSLIVKLEKEIEELKDFDTWKEWKNSVNL